jgi:hypothetical protein
MIEKSSKKVADSSIRVKTRMVGNHLIEVTLCPAKRKRVQARK